MYASHGFLRSDIGDVDVVYHDGLYHLFHLVLPNHDFIAHAVSEDALTWRRVKNALFVGEPGEWDDDMLWTMAISPNPDYDPSKTFEVSSELSEQDAELQQLANKPWRMFYTGLSRREHGRVQRIGLAVSDDLYQWTKVPGLGYPIEAPSLYYESSVDEGRHWVSFRDPYFFHHGDDRRLLVAGRIAQGPVVRRGCVAQIRETGPNQFEALPALHRPGLYDDIEVPGLFELDGRFFLLGSIREDVKVHYWVADSPDGPFGNFYDNVLLPKGNYAGRLCKTPDGPILFNFFTRHGADGSRENMLPPPKSLVTDRTGRLRLKSFAGFDGLVEDLATMDSSMPLAPLFDNPESTVERAPDSTVLLCPSGYEAFALPEVYEHFRLRCTVGLEGIGKCGLVLRVDEEGNGYYLSLDLIKGVVQIRAWGAREGGEFETAFRYDNLQAGYFETNSTGPWAMEVVALGQYIECSINGYVILTLVNDAYQQGKVGFYVESAGLSIRDLTVERLCEVHSEA